MDWGLSVFRASNERVALVSLTGRFRRVVFAAVQDFLFLCLTQNNS